MSKKLRISPAEQRVVVSADVLKEQKTASGIIIPAQVKEEKPGLGTVVATGIGSMDNPMEYRVGQRILFSQYAGLEVELNLTGEEKTYRVMNQMDVMAIIEEV